MSSNITTYGSGQINVFVGGETNVFPPPVLTLITWGFQTSGGDSTGVDISNKSSDIYSSSNAFSFINTDGSVGVWGFNSAGGSLTTPVDVSSSLSSGVASIHTSNQSHFLAAIKTDGTVVTWGNTSFGGDSSTPTNGPLTDILHIYSNSQGGVALKEDGITSGEYKAIMWGSVVMDFPVGIESSLVSGINYIIPNRDSFTALKGSVGNYSAISFGSSIGGGDISILSPSGSSVSSGIVKVVGTDSSKFYPSGSFVALKNDGSVVSWGDVRYGGSVTTPVDSSSSLISDVVDVYSSDRFCYALKGTVGNYSVITWGHQENGGDSSILVPASENLTSGVVSVHVNGTAGCVLKEDGITPGEYKVISWGSPRDGGTQEIRDSGSSLLGDVSSLLTSGVKQIFSTITSFSALKSDGSVISWGRNIGGGDNKGIHGGTVTGVIDNIETIYGGGVFYVGVKATGDVVSWGRNVGGGDSSSVQPLTGIEEIFIASTAVAVTKLI